MLLTRFEPGDGTSYLVVFHPLTDAEYEALGLADKSGLALFGFGPRGGVPIRTNLFRIVPGTYLHEDYLTEKLGVNGEWSPWTLTAALLAFEYLADREVGGSTYDECSTEVLRSWQPRPLNRNGLTWRAQLDPLKITSLA